MTVRPTITYVAAVTAVALAVLAGASCSSDTDVPADEPGATTDVSGVQTTVAPVASGVSVTDSVPTTGLVSIDGPATVDSAFGGASPGAGGG
jgi:hypothetical protein